MSNTPVRSTASTPTTSTATTSQAGRPDQVSHVHMMYPPVGYFPWHFSMYNVPARYPVAPPPAFLPYPQLPPLRPAVPAPTAYAPPVESLQVAPYASPVESLQLAPYDRSYRERLVGLREPISLRQLLQGARDFQNYPFAVTTDSLNHFLEQGCIIAQKIARKNQHRPCFKNIENLCNRMRSELIKPTNIVANVHSQGLPWATKDFIYAYIRMVNSWHMLKHYADFSPGSLGTVEQELTAEFINAFKFWEEDTKILASHMIRIFTKLNDSVGQLATVTTVADPLIFSQPSTSRATICELQPEDEAATVQSEQSSGSSHNLLQNTEPAEPYYLIPFSQPKLEEKPEQNILDSLFSWKVPAMTTSVKHDETKSSEEDEELQGAASLLPESSVRPESALSTMTTTGLWEHESGGLTPVAMDVLEQILNTMENDNLNMWLSFAQILDTFEIPTTIGMIREKLNTNHYLYVNQFMFDFKRLLSNSLKYYKKPLGRIAKGTTLNIKFIIILTGRQRIKTKAPRTS